METTAFVNTTAIPVSDISSPNIITIVVYFLVMIFICGGNALVILAIIRTPVLQTVTNAFVVNLAIADFIIGLIAIPHIINELQPQLINNYGTCVVRIGTIVTLCFVSIATLMAIAVERCIGILKPLHYSQIVTSRWSMIVITITWIYALADGLPCFIGVNTWQPGMPCLTVYVLPVIYQYVIVGEVFLFIIIIAFLYGLILHEIRHQQLHMASPASDSTSLKRNMHIAKTFLMVVGVFISCWLPYCILSLVASQLSEGDATGDSFLLSYKLVVSLVYLNSAVNPIVYALRMSTFRKAMKEIMLGNCAKLSTIQPSTVHTLTQDHAEPNLPSFQLSQT